MRQSGQSTLLFISLGLLTTLNVFNSCQIDHLERLAIEDSARLTAMEAQLRAGVPMSGAAAGASAAPGAPAAVSAQEAEALADPKNLLKARTRAWVTAPKVAPGGTLRMQIGSDPQGLNPLIAKGSDVNEYSRFFGSTLAMRDIGAPDRWVPDLAVKVTSDDDLRYRVELRTGVHWHLPAVDWSSGRYAWAKGPGPDGRQPFTAHDVVFTIDAIKNTQTAGRVSDLRTYFEPIVAYRAVDDHTLEVEFKEKAYTNRSALYELPIIPRFLFSVDEDGKAFDAATWGLKLNEHWYNQKAIGTGPLQFVSWEPGVKLEFAKDPYYYGEAVAFDRLLMSVVKDQNAWPRKLKAGELDFIYLQPEQYKTEILDDKDGVLLDNPRIKRADFSMFNYFYVGWNADRPKFADKRVRKAMTLSFNRAGVLEKVLYNQGALTSGPFPQQTPCYDKSVQPLPFDLEAAKALLEEAGWTDSDGDGVRDKVIDGQRVPFTFSLITFGGSSEYETLASIWREDLLQIGVQMQPVPLEWSAMLKKMDERDFDAFTGAWVTSWESDLMQLWHSAEADKPKSGNRIGFRNADADRIAEALRLEFDEGERVKLCHAFHRLVAEEQPYTFFYQRERTVLYWDHLNSLEFLQTPPHRDVRLFSFNQPASPAG